MISVLMAAHIDSTEKIEWINEAIKSLQAQSFTEWELILMDDCSPLSIGIDQPDDRIRYFRTTQQSGPSLCRNNAAALASYEALFPFDSDDVLADPDSLGTLFVAWDQQKDKIIYGDLQQLQYKGDRWEKGRVFDLPDYNFTKVLDLNGIIPVSAMHSRECHIKAGGWKSNLDAGLEDVEYWISAGKAGFCGHRIPGVNLLYRKHDSSRTFRLENIVRRKTEMRNLIRQMHSDVYQGRYPVGCCGGGKPYIPPETQSNNVIPPSMLAQYSNNDKVWVEYVGLRKGGFGMVGKYTNVAYEIQGPGHKLEVHVLDLPAFKRQRSPNGHDSFIVGISVPVASQPIPDPKQDIFQASAPELAQVVTLDDKARNNGW